jgi:probable F420-dependent oxidoreductase
VEIGIVTFCTEDTGSPSELATEIEHRGFESLFLTDHTHIPVSRATAYPEVYGGGELPDYYSRTHELFVALTHAAAATSVLRVGTGICLVGQRDPIVTAKAVATLDSLSGGRLAAFGVGFGWNRDELEAHGTDFAHRREITRDRVALMRRLWDDDVAQYEGEYARLAPSWSWPKPTRPPRVYLGGGGPTTMRHAAEWADAWYPVFRADDPTMERSLAKFWSIVDDVGRDRDTIGIACASVPGDPRILEGLQGHGVERVTLWLEPQPLDGARVELDRLALLLPAFARN